MAITKLKQLPRTTIKAKSLTHLPGQVQAGNYITVTSSNGVWTVSLDVTAFGANVATFLVTPSSANLAAAITDETGTGALVFATSPTLVTPALGTPASGTLTNCIGLPLSGLAAAAWTSYTPTVTASSGTFTTVSGNGWYVTYGKVALVTVQVVCTTVGTAAGALWVTLPSGVDVKAGRIGLGSLFNINATYGGNVLAGLGLGTRADCYKYDGTFPITSGQTCWMTVSYEIA